MKEKKILIFKTEDFILFPNQGEFLLKKSLSDKEAKILTKVFSDEVEKYLILASSNFAIGNQGEMSGIGTLVQISSFSPHLPAGVVLKGIERVRIIDPKDRDDFLCGNYEVLKKVEISEGGIFELGEKFVRKLPRILDKSKILLTTLTKGAPLILEKKQIEFYVDYIAQHGKEISVDIK
jgi:hypothetical protein